jgi:hypothetical protein
VRLWDKAASWGYKYSAHSASILFEHSHLLSLLAIGFIPATMERVRKTFFNPLATSKAHVQKILEDLPLGSAHPFSPEQILLCRTENGIEEIDISSYPENFFFNAIDLGEMGEVLLRRMAGFQSHLSMSSLSNEYMDGEGNINNVQRYSRTSRLCKHQHQHLKSLSSQIKLRFLQFLNEHPLTTTSASRMNRVGHAAGLQEIPSRESPTAEIFSMDRISSIM